LFKAGAGIVADSDPEKEWWETVNKAKALMKAGGYGGTVISLLPVLLTRGID
jgi:anthranilate/para-aminobenzoate synthase component I